MSMPIDLVLVRHGESEGNVARGLSEQGDESVFTDEFCQRHDSRLRLTNLGRTQAKTTGKWIQENIGTYFDRYIVSVYARAMETAGLLDLPGAQWRPSIHLRERDMGYYDNMSEQEKRQKYPEAYAQYSLDPFYWTPPNGESLATLCLRISRILDTLHRECSDRRVIIVCHGMVMWAFRIVIERWAPWEFLDRSKRDNEKEKIRNCQVIHYTRKNPATGIISNSCDWVRSVCPWHTTDQALSWGEIERSKYSNHELLLLAEYWPSVIS